MGVRGSIDKNTEGAFACSILSKWNHLLPPGGEEHCILKLSQLKHENDSPRYVYTELASKNRAGGLAQLQVKNKWKYMTLYMLYLKLETWCHVPILICI